jgi:hypothetical protein
MKARQKCPMAGPTTGYGAIQATCIEEKQRVRQPTVRYAQKRTNIYIHTQTSMHVDMYDCMRSESESESGRQL